jgi:hypothetical protein
MRDGFLLRTKLRKRIPNAVQQHKHGLNAMSIGDLQVLIRPLEQALSVLSPQHIMQVDTHGVQTNFSSPTQFMIDGLRVKSFCLPHFQLIGCSTGNKIRTGQPTLLSVPLIGPLCAPPTFRKFPSYVVNVIICSAFNEQAQKHNGDKRKT